MPWVSVVVCGVLQFGVSYGLVFWAEQWDHLVGGLLILGGSAIVIRQKGR